MPDEIELREIARDPRFQNLTAEAADSGGDPAQARSVYAQQVQAAQRQAVEDALGAVRANCRGLPQAQYAEIVRALSDGNLAEKTLLIERANEPMTGDPLVSSNAPLSRWEVAVSEDEPVGDDIVSTGSVAELYDAALGRLVAIGRRERFADMLEEGVSAVERGEVSRAEFRELANDVDDLLAEMRGAGLVLSVDESGNEARAPIELSDNDTKVIRRVIRRGNIEELRKIEVHLSTVRGVEGGPETLQARVVRHPAEPPADTRHHFSARQLAAHVAREALMTAQFGPDAIVLTCPTRRRLFGI